MVATRMAATASCWMGVGMASCGVAVMRACSNGSIALTRHEDLCAPRCGLVSNVHVVIYVVDDRVICAIVLVVAGTLGAGRHIVLKKLVSRAFIRVYIIL